MVVQGGGAEHGVVRSQELLLKIRFKMVNTESKLLTSQLLVAKGVTESGLCWENWHVRSGCGGEAMTLLLIY